MKIYVSLMYGQLRPAFMGVAIMAKRDVTRFSLNDLLDYAGVIFLIPGLILAALKAKINGWQIDPKGSCCNPKMIEETFVQGTKTFYRYCGVTWVISNEATTR